ncbi:MAG: molybdopterin oxidoreductase [Sandaracinaceae bacterium]
MSKRAPTTYVAHPDDGEKPIWRSLAEKADPEKRQREAAEEIGVQVGSLLPSSSLVSRRTLFKVTGATAAAVGLSGCLRRPAEQILPYTQGPEYSLPGATLHFATSTSHHGEAIGLLVESHEGRPTKIEGNPNHTRSLGATDGQLQARVLDLYDPDRSRSVSQRGGGGESGAGRTGARWSDWDAFWRERAQAHERTEGRGLHVLAPPSDSPSWLRARDELVRRFPAAKMHRYAPISDDNAREGSRLAFGEYVASSVDYHRASCILALDSDFLGLGPSAIANARGFADGRRLRSPSDSMNRLYVVEGGLTVTGMNADHRLRLAPSRIGHFLRALGSEIGRVGRSFVTLPIDLMADLSNVPPLEGVDEHWIREVARDLLHNLGHAVITVGASQPPYVHALAHALNVLLNAAPNEPSPIAYQPDVDGYQSGTIAELVRAMSAGEVETLVILGGNPVYDAPADLGFADALEHVQHSVHLADRLNETSQACAWHLPMTHELESWGDHRASDGTLSLQQPLIAPIFGGRSSAEVLAQMAGIRGWRGYHLVRNTMRAMVGSEALDLVWRRSLHQGVLLGMSRPEPIRPSVMAAAVAEALPTGGAEAGDGWEIQFAPSYQVYDGEQANNQWLLEMPDPITKLVWDNAACISPSAAESLGVREGDFLSISVGERSIEIPAFILPGQADRVVTLNLGFGRHAAGRYGTDVGFDVYPLRTVETMGFAGGASVQKGTGVHNLVQTQEHHSMEGRPLVRDATLEEYKATPNYVQFPSHHGEPDPDLSPLWTQVDYSEPLPPAHGGTSYSLIPGSREARPGAPARYKWGLVVDLTTCTGCSTCIIACQSENNVTTVGKRQVELGREMHWMRLDRYFIGEDANDPQVAIQPIACQQCEEAPCENVCPVAATAHSPEGLNDMAYNRCIGTRYCMNNCPYKVRRFNFLDFYGEIPETRRMQFNPNVTVRMRGVMEKCSYCVQRIQAARIESRRRTTVNSEGEITEVRIGPRDVTPACAQACPSQAITFGDLNDTESEAHRLAHLDRRYSLLGQVGTQPRTTYLGKVRNPNPEMV